MHRSRCPPLCAASILRGGAISEDVKSTCYNEVFWTNDMRCYRSSVDVDVSGLRIGVRVHLASPCACVVSGVALLELPGPLLPDLE